MSTYDERELLRMIHATKAAHAGLSRARTLTQNRPHKINTTAAIRATKTALAMLHEIQEWQERTQQ